MKPHEKLVAVLLLLAYVAVEAYLRGYDAGWNTRREP